MCAQPRDGGADARSRPPSPKHTPTQSPRSLAGFHHLPFITSRQPFSSLCSTICAERRRRRRRRRRQRRGACDAGGGSQRASQSDNSKDDDSTLTSVSHSLWATCNGNSRRRLRSYSFGSFEATLGSMVFVLLLLLLLLLLRFLRVRCTESRRRLYRSPPFSARSRAQRCSASVVWWSTGWVVGDLHGK